MENKRAKELIKKYLDGTCTSKEKTIIESWYLKETIERDTTENDSVDYLEMEETIWNELSKVKHKKTKIIWYRVAAAAIVASILLIYFPTRHEVDNQITQQKVDVLPGSNKAVLILSDRSKIYLDDSDNGIVAEEAGVHIRKLIDGQLVYDTVIGTSATVLAYNTIETPRGGQYQISLPDGTKAWLNAASSLTFPTVFAEDERVVKITGEVYFEVAHQKDKPFRVKTVHQTIEVLGTHFNVNAYPEESTVQTSLLEGSISVSAFGKKTVIRPGEQTVLSPGEQNLKVLKIRPEDEIAWKNGYFNFNGQSIKTVMNKISRWYDVDIEYHKDFVDQGFIGTISKFESVSKVLRMLELTGTVHFKMEGRRIIVMP